MTRNAQPATRYRSIVISGQIASGTTTAARTLAKEFGLDLHVAGEFFRKYFEEHHIPLAQKDKIPDEIDRQIDKGLTDLAASQKPVVIDAHYFGYFTRDMPHVLKVLLTCDDEVRYERAKSRISTFVETKQDVKEREKGLDAKFRKLYADENFLDPKFFDMIIDTTNTKPEEVAGKIANKFTSG